MEPFLHAFRQRAKMQKSNLMWVRNNSASCECTYCRSVFCLGVRWVSAQRKTMLMSGDPVELLPFPPLPL